jgi:hypothetical protein
MDRLFAISVSFTNGFHSKHYPLPNLQFGSKHDMKLKHTGIQLLFKFFVIPDFKKLELALITHSIAVAFSKLLFRVLDFQGLNLNPQTIYII